jgi:hypothetical protein
VYTDYPLWNFLQTGEHGRCCESSSEIEGAPGPVITTDAVATKYLRLRAYRLTAAVPLTAHTQGVAHRLRAPART